MKLWPFSKKQKDATPELGESELPPGVMLAEDDSAAPPPPSAQPDMADTGHSPSPQAPSVEFSPEMMGPPETSVETANPQAAMPADPAHNVPPNAGSYDAPKPDLNQFFDQNTLTMLSQPAQPSAESILTPEAFLPPPEAATEPTNPDPAEQAPSDPLSTDPLMAEAAVFQPEAPGTPPPVPQSAGPQTEDLFFNPEPTEAPGEPAPPQTHSQALQADNPVEMQAGLPPEPLAQAPALAGEPGNPDASFWAASPPTAPDTPATDGFDGPGAAQAFSEAQTFSLDWPPQDAAAPPTGQSTDYGVTSPEGEAHFELETPAPAPEAAAEPEAAPDATGEDPVYTLDGPMDSTFLVNTPVDGFTPDPTMAVAPQPLPQAESPFVPEPATSLETDWATPDNASEASPPDDKPESDPFYAAAPDLNISHDPMAALPAVEDSFWSTPDSMAEPMAMSGPTEETPAARQEDVQDAAHTEDWSVSEYVDAGEGEYVFEAGNDDPETSDDEALADDTEYAEPDEPVLANLESYDLGHYRDPDEEPVYFSLDDEPEATAPSTYQEPAGAALETPQMFSEAISTPDLAHDEPGEYVWSASDETDDTEPADIELTQASPPPPEPVKSVQEAQAPSAPAQATRQPVYSMTEAIMNFEQQVMLEDSRFLSRSINTLVEQYFANQPEEQAS